MAKTVKGIRNGGRPPKSEEDRKDKMVSFRVDALTRMVIDEKVKESKLAMGEFIRRALRNAEITPAEYEGYFREIKEFSAGRLLDFIVVSVEVIQPWSKAELKALKSLYRFAGDVNALVKRGNASLGGAPSDVKINYLLEFAHLQDEFNEIKDYFLKRILGRGTPPEVDTDDVTIEEEIIEDNKEELL